MKLLTFLGAGVLAIALAACGPSAESTSDNVEEPRIVTLAEIAAGDQRTPENVERDQFRNPVETLEFFGLQPGMTVVEIWPGNGWYTEIIAPYLAANGGTYYAAGFDPEGASERGLARIAAFNERFVADKETFGDVRVTAFSAKSGPIAPAGSADLVLTFRNVHNWMGGEFTEKAFADFYAALKPGGILGVVEHRLPEGREQDPKASSGYVREDVVIAFAEAAGFELVNRSELNANPADTADHPFGVWTLPPVSRTSAYRGTDNPDFDSAPYLVIGESDRMTLKFRKSLTADGALLE